MIPISDENPTLRPPIVTVAILVALGAVWVLVQGAGFDSEALISSVCNLGLVAGELTRRAALGTAVPMGGQFVCVVDNDAINLWTPLTSMFLHGGWGHLLGNALFLWVFGNNIEDSMGHLRFVIFYLVCGLCAAFGQVAFDPAAAVPMVGASGAISGVMGAYLVLYPRARVNMLFFFFVFIRVIPLPAWLVLLWWFGLQLLSTLGGAAANGGVAVWAHIGGFLAGALLIKVFERDEWVDARSRSRRTLVTRRFL